MKVRKGFVSNSSSSSFLIYGVCLDEDKDKYNELEETIEDQPGKTELSCITMMGDYFWIGRSWGSVKDDETGKQFKESVERSLKELGIESQCCTYKEGWYDG